MFKKHIAFCVALGLAVLGIGKAHAIDYVDNAGLSQVIKTPVKSCGSFRELKVPGIAWGADMVELLGNGSAKRTAPGSIFAGHKLDIQLYRQDDFKKQVEDYLTCNTPFLRGTMGMLNQASELLSRDPRTAPVVIYQLSWSNGGDALVVKEGIKTPADLRGKTVAVQAYGPHVDYLLKILADAGVKPADVKIKWTADLLQVNDKSVSPALAFRKDQSVDAAFVISPDALALTSNGTVGTGSEDSVRGARILLTTKTANRIIADVYAVRSDYFQAHRDEIEHFTNGLMQAEEKLRGLFKDKKNTDYKQMITASAEFLLDSPTAINDAEGMYGDAELVNYGGNIKFFTDSANPRGFDKLATEIQQSLMSIGLISKQVPLAFAQWDYAKLAVGLADTKGVEMPRFDAQAVQQITEQRTKQSSKEGVLFEFEVYFGANQNTFPADQYKQSFDRVIELASTYGGALMAIEGHSDPLGYLKQKKASESSLVLNRTKQAAKNLSYSRANAVKDSIIGYASGKGITLDSSQFGVVGLGVSQPNTPNCKMDANGDIDLSCAPATEQQWNATRRVVFKIIQIEAETAAFKPL